MKPCYTTREYDLLKQWYNFQENLGSVLAGKKIQESVPVHHQNTGYDYIFLDLKDH